jgi:hypothetical protein
MTSYAQRQRYIIITARTTNKTSTYGTATNTTTTTARTTKKTVFTGPMQQQQMGQITQQPQQLRAEQGIEEVAEQQKLDLI